MSSLRILMCSFDEVGLEQTSRAISIAATLTGAIEDCSILLLTDLSTIGRLKLPAKVDFVHLPRVARKNSNYHSTLGLNIEQSNTLKIRHEITQSTIKTFRPDILIFDESFLGSGDECKEIVSCISDELPNAKVIWGLSDTQGNPEYVISKWKKEGIFDIFDLHSDEIWIYGSRENFDYAEKYQLPEYISNKLLYTGYLTSQSVLPRTVCKDVASLNQGLPTVVLLCGNDSDDYAFIDSYLRFIEAAVAERSFQSIIMAGPSISSRKKRELMSRAQRLPNTLFKRFSKHGLHYIRFADLVISRGSYSVISEIVAHRKPSVIVPNYEAQSETYTRASLFEKLGFITILEPKHFSGDALGSIINNGFYNVPRIISRTHYEQIRMDGFSVIVDRIHEVAEHPRSMEMMVV